ncbi:MAG TPA: TIGR02266 family protein [Labilithrix sp.]|nr:TIGR02266 family protein [Labilithrix sp.]
MMGKDERATPARTPVASVDDSERRIFDRYDVEWSVDCVATDTFLYASITNISEMGIFVRTTDPLKLNTKLRLTFAPPGAEGFQLDGCVAWVNNLRENGDNPNPGMGIRFVDLQPEERERLVEVIRTIAYLRDLPRYD